DPGVKPVAVIPEGKIQKQIVYDSRTVWQWNEAQDVLCHGRNLSGRNHVVGKLRPSETDSGACGRIEQRQPRHSAEVTCPKSRRGRGPDERLLRPVEVRLEVDKEERSVLPDRGPDCGARLREVRTRYGKPPRVEIISGIPPRVGVKVINLAVNRVCPFRGHGVKYCPGSSSPLSVVITGDDVELLYRGARRNVNVQQRHGLIVLNSVEQPAIRDIWKAVGFPKTAPLWIDDEWRRLRRCDTGHQLNQLFRARLEHWGHEDRPSGERHGLLT